MYDLISPNNLDDLPGSFPPPLIVDVRPKAPFESAGHMLSGAPSAAIRNHSR
jgi:hypothetical protein